MSVQELLVSDSRNYVVGHDRQVPVADLFSEGSYVGLYFSAHWCGPCRNFTPMLKKCYEEIRAAGHKFEIVFVSSDSDDASFNEYYGEMPWLSLPFAERDAKDQLAEKYTVEGIPTLVIVDAAGNTVTADGTSMVRQFGSKAFPFTAEKLHQLEEEKNALLRNLTVKSLLQPADGKLFDGQGNKYNVDHFDNKVVGFYFSAHWCPPCRMFTPQLAQLYRKLKEENKEFEIVFISSDSDEEEFQGYFREMPWLALPFEERTMKQQIATLFEIRGIPSLVLFDATGHLLSKDGRGLVSRLGAEGYPFSPEQEQKKAAEEKARMESFPKEVVDKRHPHPLALLPSVYGGSYGCDGCGKGGSGYVYHCEGCKFDLHPDCIQKE